MQKHFNGQTKNNQWNISSKFNMKTSVLTTQIYMTVRCWWAKTAYRSSVYMMIQKHGRLQSCYTESGYLSQQCRVVFSGEQPGLNNLWPVLLSISKTSTNHTLLGNKWNYRYKDYSDWKIQRKKKKSEKCKYCRGGLFPLVYTMCLSINMFDVLP